MKNIARTPWLCLLIPMSVLSMGLQQAPDPKEEREKRRKDREEARKELQEGGSAERVRDAEKRIAAFQKKFGEAKTREEKIEAMRWLADMKHPRILKVLIPLLSHGDLEIGRAVADEMGEYHEDIGLYGVIEEAAEALMRAIKENLKHKETAETYFLALGNLRCSAATRFIHEYFLYPDDDIAASAIQASGLMRNKDSIPVLITFLAQAEHELYKIKNPDPNRPGPSSSQGSDDLLLNQTQKRMEKLRPPILSSLSTLTGQGHSSSGAWVDWWKKNKATFKVKD